ncbi:hypothetical protein HMPREF9318_00061 [Streptococcus urinalis FB127-CNA-2]|uniref:Uncharacterized protein n=1 Tax=Streptococcus urinalis 2285-97 TaxID=764291 RepID=G5KEG7_9STRE|nr:hypothetical protein [Streptococcus urinalis]QBX22125.1 hypothetical protein Javan637_0017 [Streptococcus phage Javan637]QBX31581.1 hypothetical protein Javan642_0017 [Streptococcus phage Javan642]QBX31674.1 hypothetical protein Javan648_0048 [Streptococcus phage Javan648]EHJ56333.1 hypothetical protein STRUR_0801 [Streptococcus urinalis 2285-97]EKS21863.1 hypothetical protein HMPREF9318_00061 [Streptococcus urinalis FB127-CNA-2]
MKKLFNWIFAKPKEEPEVITYRIVKPENYEFKFEQENSRPYEEYHKYMVGVMMRGAK